MVMNRTNSRFWSVFHIEPFEKGNILARYVQLLDDRKLFLLIELTRGTFNIGSKRRSEAIPPDIAIRNDHMSVPVVSAIQPAMIGEIMVPIPK
jgi:hypothetical protein